MFGSRTDPATIHSPAAPTWQLSGSPVLRLCLSTIPQVHSGADEAISRGPLTHMPDQNNPTLDGAKNAMDLIQSFVAQQIARITETTRADLGRTNTGRIRDYLRILDELDQALRHLDEVQRGIDRLGAPRDGPDSPTIPSTPSPRKIVISVSQGMINQNLLTLTSARKRGLVRSGEQFIVTLPNGRQFKTDLCPSGNKLRERGQIRAFYEEAQIRCGERVILVESEPQHWRLMRWVPEESESGRASP